MNPLLEDLTEAAQAAAGEKPCRLCDYIQATEHEATREALVSAAAGSIGINKLASILHRREIGIGRRTIQKHRNERHEP